jgi:hypothetical protein
MNKNILLVFSVLSFVLPASAQNSNKGNFYFLWGYNRDTYTRSTIHFQNDGDPSLEDQYGVYDFKVYKVKAHDRPDFDGIKDVVNITIPQFSSRVGYYFNNKRNEGLELNYDHAKYVVTDYQTAHFKGQILNKPVDKDSVLDPNYFHIEHTDGANFWSLNYMRRWQLTNKSNTKFNLNFIAKAGAGLVVPRTDVTIFGHNVNNQWKVAGPCANIEVGFQALLWKHFMLEFTGKGVYASYMNCLVQGKGHGKVSQTFLAGEGILCFGWLFGKKETK